MQFTVELILAEKGLFQGCSTRLHTLLFIQIERSVYGLHFTFRKQIRNGRTGGRQSKRNSSGTSRRAVYF